MKEDDIDLMPAGDGELDRAIDLLVFGTPYLRGFNIPEYSTEWKYAGRVMEKTEELVTRFHTADGFTKLMCGHFGDHGNCAPHMEGEYDQELDPEPWTFHLHLGCVGEDSGCPKWWGYGEKEFCARGSTGPEAIARACLKAFDPELVRNKETIKEEDTIHTLVTRRLKDYEDSKSNGEVE